MLLSDLGTLTEEMQFLDTSDYMGGKFWESMSKEEDPDESYPFPLVLKRDRASSVASAAHSGVSTPSGGRRLTENDLASADEALGKFNGGGQKK